MRFCVTVPLLTLSLFTIVATPDPGRPLRADQTAAAPDPDEARWAEWEAQARVIDGDYDGAVQAEQQAKAERHKVDR